MHAEPRLIGVDWGTSSLRAYLLGDGGTVLARRSQPWGVMAAPGRDFPAALQATIGAWDIAHPGLPVLACGMIGSTEGWVHAPYVACPAGLAELAAQIVAVPATRDGSVHIVPGVELRGAAPNVMRGEETQIAGAFAVLPELQAHCVLVLPGTHSKWVEIRDGRSVRFDTYMTGELYALLAEHSILARPARAATSTQGSAPASGGEREFERAVGLSRDSGERGVAPLLFLTRSLVLAGLLAPGDCLEFLSGLLVGDELRCAVTFGNERIALVGEPALCRRYARAFAAFGLTAPAVLGETAPVGLWRVACNAGLAACPASYA